MICKHGASWPPRLTACTMAMMRYHERAAAGRIGVPRPAAWIAVVEATCMSCRDTYGTPPYLASPAHRSPPEVLPVNNLPQRPVKQTQTTAGSRLRPRPQRATSPAGSPGQRMPTLPRGVGPSAAATMRASRAGRVASDIGHPGLYRLPWPRVSAASGLAERRAYEGRVAEGGYLTGAT